MLKAGALDLTLGVWGKSTKPKFSPLLISIRSIMSFMGVMRKREKLTMRTWSINTMILSPTSMNSVGENASVLHKVALSYFEQSGFAAGFATILIIYKDILVQAKRRVS